MNTRELINARLNASPQPPKKQIAIRIRQDQMERLTYLAKIMTEVSGRKTTRNVLIEDAIEAFVVDSLDFIKTYEKGEI